MGPIGHSTYQIVTASGRSLVQRSPTECGVSECDRGTSQGRPRLTMDVEQWKKKPWNIINRVTNSVSYLWSEVLIFTDTTNTVTRLAMYEKRNIDARS